MESDPHETTNGMISYQENGEQQYQEDGMESLGFVDEEQDIFAGNQII